MKRLFFGLFAAATALGASAFTSAPVKPTANFYYVLSPDGTYVRTLTEPTPAFCEDLATEKCWIGYDTNQGASFPSDDLPEAPITDESDSNGAYVPE